MKTPVLPFKLNFSHNQTLPPDGLLVRLQAAPDDDEPLTGEEYAGSLSLLDLFAQCVHAQFFRGHSTRPALMQAQSLQWDASLQACVWQGQAQQVPSSAWVYLMALLNKSHDALEPLGQVSIEMGSAHSLPQWPHVCQQITEDFDLDRYAFTCAAPGIDASRNVLLEFEFVDALTKTQADEVIGLCSLWQQLNVLGAFDLEFGEADDLDPMRDAEQVSSIRVTCMIPYFRGHLSGLQILFNMVAHVHSNVAPIEEVILG